MTFDVKMLLDNLVHIESLGGARKVVNLMTDSCGRKFVVKTVKNPPTLEMQIYQWMEHPHIASSLKVVYNTEDSGASIYMNYYGDNLEILLYNHGTFPEKDACTVISQIALALQYLHSRGITHRDVKLANVLMSSHGAVLCDFDMSSKRPVMRARCGTPYYMAPEVIKGSYDCRVDIWSLGVLMTKLLTDVFPYKTNTVKEIYGKIEVDDPYISEELSDDAVDLINRLLVKDPEQRITLEQLLKHPWITSYSIT